MIDLAYAMGTSPAGGSASPWVQFLQSPLPAFVMIFVIFYFLLFRPQQRERKRKEEMLTSLKKGDRVTTTGGLIGTITNLNDQTVILKIADSVRVECLRSAVTGLRAAGRAESDSA